VTGIDIGPKYTDQVRTRRTTIRIHVVEKRSRRRVRPFERIPETILGVPTDVVESSYRSHSGGGPAARCPTLQAGVSVGNINANAGTLGLVVYEVGTGDPCILGAWHVLAGPHGRIGDEITQPARLDNGSLANDVIATLTAAPPPGLWGDAALAKLNGKRPVSSTVFGTNRSIDTVSEVTAGRVVKKSGRTTGVTRGRVEGVGTYFYPDLPGGVAGFRIVPEHDDPTRFDLAAEGDSGAVYFDAQTGAGVGLHCAGGVDSILGEVAVACSLSTVLAVLGASLTPP
jgi:endonuclease G